MEGNPGCLASVSLFDRYVTEWFDVTETFNLDSYFFKDVTFSSMQTCSIAGARHETILENNAGRILELLKQNVTTGIVWMQKSDLPHIATSVRQVLRQPFGDRFIARNFSDSMQVCSSNLTPTDFWF